MVASCFAAACGVAGAEDPSRGGPLPVSLPSALLGGLDGPVEVETADLNGDGEPDLVTAAFDGDVIEYWLSSGTAPIGFEAPRLVGGMDGPFDIEIADFNGDNRLDIVAVSVFSDTVELFRNDGPSNAPVFTRIVLSTTTVNPRDVAVGDLLGDGGVDIVVAGTGDNTALIALENTGGLVFDEWRSGLDETIFGIDTADVNGDDSDEIVLTTLSGALLVQDFTSGPKDSPPSPLRFFTTVDLIVSAAGSDGPFRDVAFGDLNGDDWIDILVVDDTPGSERVRSFLHRSTTVTWDENDSIPFGDVSGLEIEDFDLDGRDDVAFTVSGPSSPPQSEVIVSLSKREILVSQLMWETITLPVSGVVLADPGVGDLDRDGYPDVLLPAFTTDEVLWVENLSEGPVYNLTRNTVHDTLDEGQQAAGTGDLLRADPSALTGPIDFRDGRVFVSSRGPLTSDGFITFTGGPNGIEVLPADGGQNDFEQRGGEIRFAGSGDGEIVLNDGDFILRGDARLDLDDTQKINVRQDGGSADASLEGTIDLGNGGYLELDTSGEVRLSRKLLPEDDPDTEEPEGFTVVGIDLPAGYSEAKSVLAADLDGDGDDDAVFTAQTADSVVLGWVQTVDILPFPVRTIFETGSSTDIVRGLSAGDLDGDGDIDLFTTTEDPDMTDHEWFENLGGPSPSFARRTIPATFFRATRAEIVDLDGDGDLDPVASFYNVADDATYIVWYENTGSGFNEQVLFNEPGPRATMELGDLDGDGLVDIVLEGDFEVTCSLQRREAGEIEFVLSCFYPGLFENMWIGVEDLNLDGRDDVVLADGSMLIWIRYEPTPVVAALNGVRLRGDPFLPRFFLGDVDGDKRPDLIEPLDNTFLPDDPAPGFIAARESLGRYGQGGFQTTTERSWSAPLVSGLLGPVAFGDMFDNGDGAMEILTTRVSSEGGERLVWLVTPSFSPRVEIDGPAGEISTDADRVENRTDIRLDGQFSSTGVFVNYGNIQGAVEGISTLRNENELLLRGDSSIQIIENIDRMRVATDATVEFAEFRNSGRVEPFPSMGRGATPGRLLVFGDFFTEAGSTFRLDASQRLEVRGDIDIAIVDARDAASGVNPCFDVPGELALTGASGPQLLEAVGLDRGANAVGLDPARSGNFPLGTLRIGAGADVTLVDNRVNHPGAGGEALYVNTLIAEDGATLNAGMSVIYAGEIQGAGSISGAVFTLPPGCATDLDGDGSTGSGDLGALLSQWGSAGSADFDGDGAVGSGDLGTLIAAWGPCP